MMCPESFFELCPGEPSASREHGHVIVPPCACRTLELLSYKSCLVIVIVWVQSELGLNGPKRAAGFQWFIRLMKKLWLGSQKLRVPRNRQRVVNFRPRHCPLLHKLTEECRLLITPSEYSRNGLNQIGWWRWVSRATVRHSAFNHDWISHIILIT